MDEQINSRNTVLKNIYQIVTFVAMKFHSYTRSLSHNNNNAFFWGTIYKFYIFINIFILILLQIKDTIMDIATRLQFFVNIKVNGSYARKSNCQSTVSPLEIMWLSFFAFLTVLSKKQTKYGKLLLNIRQYLNSKKFEKINLLYITNQSMISLHEDILF